MNWLPISFTSFWNDVKSYPPSFLKKDLLAALSVALLAIPQSIAYSLLAGLPPSAGLFCAIFGTIFTATFGSSRYLISGPSTSVAILIQTAIAEILNSYYGTLSAVEKDVVSLQILTHIVLMIGLIQIFVGIFQIGKFLQFVSRSVILGYFSGVMIAILVNQTFYFLGINSPTDSSSVVSKVGYLIFHINQLELGSLSIGLFSAFLILFMKKKNGKIPYTLIMLILASTLTYFISMSSLSLKIPTLHDMGFLGHPLWKWTILTPDLELIGRLLPSAVAISLLSILEVFSISRMLSAKSGQPVHSNQEVFALGISNTFLSFLSGSMPASGSISRSALNFQQKAKTRFSAVFSGILLALLVFFFWPFIRHIPLASLAAILIILSPTVLDREEIILSLKATKGDRLVFVLTFASCILFTLDIAFFIGIILAIALYLKKAA